ncbi:uncharacterized protein [Dendrobates tinctorius]|uniref:uncharacterized protein n=1 Tax=Dendrobates tinctorius TaxID=92724 RepID=UPI003CCA6D55
MDDMKNLHPKLPTFYISPKLHKNPMDPPGRPIVAGNEGLCEIISNIVDYFLKPIVSTLPSFIKDTTSALQCIDQLHLERNMIMVTADVEALYTSIRHSDGLAATKWFLNTSNISSPIDDLILISLEFVLHDNVFTFNNSIFLQMQGTAMGVSCAPAYANLFLGAWERDLFQGDLIQGVNNVHNWMRYIDDIFYLWEGTVDDLNIFMSNLNKNDINLRLTFHHGRKLDFLDLYISASSDGRLRTEVFRKPTTTNSLLQTSSSHPGPTIKSIPIGQFLRAKRICSDEGRFENQATDLIRRFKARVYSNRCIKRGNLRAKNTTRDQLLYGKPLCTDQKKQEKVRFISNYNNQWRALTDDVRKHWGVLLVDPVLKNILPSAHSFVAKRSANLKDLLVRSHYISPTSRVAHFAGTDRGSFFPMWSLQRMS